MELSARFRRALMFLVYMATGAAVLTAVILTSYVRNGLLNTGIVLGGWDTPIYMWHAKLVIQYGPSYYMNEVAQYPAFYVQLLALLGAVFGSVTPAQVALPVALGILRILLYALLSYRISLNVHVAGLATILTSVSVGNLWLVGEYHRNSLAYDLALLVILLISSSTGARHFFLVPLLFFLTAGTQFETLGLLSLVVILSSIITKNWRMLMLSVFSTILATGILILAFPSWLDWYYLNPASYYGLYAVRHGHTYHDLIFWSIGSSALIPIGFLGIFNMYERVKHKETRETCLPTFLLCSIILISSLATLYVGFPSYGLRSIITLPVGIILALGIQLILRLVRTVSIEVNLQGLGPRHSIIVGKAKIISVIGLMLSGGTIYGLTYVDSDPYGLHYQLFPHRSPMEFVTDVLMVPFVSVSAYSKIVAVQQYLQRNNLQVPIIMFSGGSIGAADLYRAYIFNELGEHLAYIGDLTNLLDLRPTVWPPSSPFQEEYNFSSQKYLAVMQGAKEYRPVTPQIYVINDKSDLLMRPVVYLVPELYDTPPPYILTEKFRVAEGVYVVPSLNMIASLVREARQEDQT